MSHDKKDTFQLYDLRVDVIIAKGDNRRVLCGARPGDYFELKGEMLVLPENQGFSIYSLGAILPLLAAKQRCTEKRDWMWTDAIIACPDPNCPTQMRITRTGTRTFTHGETTVVPLDGAFET